MKSVESNVKHLIDIALNSERSDCSSLSIGLYKVAIILFVNDILVIVQKPLVA